MKRIFAHLCVILLLVTAASADRNIYQLEDTAAERRLPIYLVDATDGLTEETAIATTGAECRISKNGAASADCAGTFTANETGLYYYEATTGEINTLGYVTVRIADAAARKFIATANVVAYDPTSGERFIPPRGTAVGATASSIQLAAVETFADDELNNNTSIHIVSATAGGGQTRCVCDYVGSTDTATLCEDWTTTPTGTILYSLRDAPHCNSLQPTVNGRTLDVAATGEAGTDLSNVNGTLDAIEIGTAAFTAIKFGAGAIDAAALAADAGTEIGTATWATTTRQLTGTQTFNNTGTWTGNLSGSVGSVTGAVGSVAGSVGSVTGAVGSVTGSVGSVTGAVGSVAGNVGGNVTGSVASVTAPVTAGALNTAALSDLFDTNSGTTYAAAAAGSVVKEIVDNAGGGSGDVTIHTGTAQSVTLTTLRMAALETYGDNVLADNASIMILASSGATTAVGQVRCVKSNVASTDTATLVNAWKILPAGVIEYAVLPDSNCNLAKYPGGH